MSQSLSDLSFGTDDTFEVMTWNIEWFPKNGQTTVDSVSAIIQSLDIDLYAFQEITDTTLFKQMIYDIDDYEYYFQSSWFGGLAFVYKTSVIEIDSMYEIYTEEPYWRPFPRSPMVMDMNYQDQKYYIINNHFKCCGNGTMDLSDSWDEETRRFDASNLLKDYIDVNLPDENVIVLGDLNDILTDASAQNVFQTILDDDGNYLFADIDIANGPSSGWSYPSWPSHIDHIFITNELFDSFGNNNSIIQTIEIDNYMDGGFNAYNEIISDHLPVALMLANDLDLIDNVTLPQNYYLTNYPNPFNPTTVLDYDIPENSFVNITVYDMMGRRVKTLVNANQSAGFKSVVWDATNFVGQPVATGLYMYTIVAGDFRQTKKMAFIK